MILICLNLGVLLFLLKKTDFIYDYLKLVDFKDERYEALKDSNLHINYLDFLHAKHGGFYTKLISCPFCLGLWFAIIPCLFFGWLAIGLHYLIILMTFTILSKLLKIANS